MDVVIGLAVIATAGILQGSFVLPMTLTKAWQWEHTWATFSLFGMILLNWLLALIFVPNITEVYQSVPTSDVIILCAFGLAWGIGAVLFGIGMDKLGMALGYPVIMGLIASLGFLIPMVVLHPQEILTTKGMVIIAGNLLVLLGIVVCSKAASAKEGNTEQKSGILAGLIIAIAAGILSCFPNIGMAFGTTTIDAAVQAGTSPSMAGNAVWALFFTMGFIPNILYTFFLIVRNKNFNTFFASSGIKNIGLGFAMAMMWIGSFYLYGIGATRLGSWGAIIGWPLFIALSIFVGNIWGISRGEWKGASAQSRKLLNWGLAVFFIAIITIGLGNLF